MQYTSKKCKNREISLQAYNQETRAVHMANKNIVRLRLIDF